MPSVLNTATATGVGFNAMSSAARDVYSAEIWFAALPVMKFDQFSTKKTELGVQPGKTINLPKYGNLKRGGALTEGRKIETQGMSLSSASITVTEYGNAIAFSEFLLQTSFYDQLTAASLLLGRDMALVLDLGLRDSFLGVSNVIYPNSKTARIQLLANVDRMSTTLVREATESLEGANAPKWAGDHYICFIHTHQGSSLKRDNDWTNASLYSGSTQIYTGEIGRFDDVRFIATTVMANGRSDTLDPNTGDYVDVGYVAALKSGTAGNLATIYQAVMFGEYSVGHATALPVELRDNGVTDFGREHGLAWYAIWGQAALETVNTVVMETT